jgi:hypothetical protein
VEIIKDEERLVEKKTKTTYSKIKVKYSQSQVKEGAEWGQNISDIIEQYLKQVLDQNGKEILEIKRK